MITSQGLFFNRKVLVKSNLSLLDKIDSNSLALKKPLGNLLNLLRLKETLRNKMIYIRMNIDVLRKKKIRKIQKMKIT